MGLVGAAHEGVLDGGLGDDDEGAAGVGAGLLVLCVPLSSGYKKNAAKAPLRKLGLLKGTGHFASTLTLQAANNNTNKIKGTLDRDPCMIVWYVFLLSS